MGTTVQYIRLWRYKYEVIEFNVQKIQFKDKFNIVKELPTHTSRQWVSVVIGVDWDFVSVGCLFWFAKFNFRVSF